MLAFRLVSATALAVVATSATALAQGPPPASPEPEADPPHQRLWMAAPPAGRAGRGVELSIRRRGEAGRYVTRLCEAPPARGWSCRKLTLADGTRRITPAVRTPSPGRWLFELRNGSQRVREAVRVRPRGGRLRVLATGDSMIQIVDAFMRERLGSRASLRSEAHISTGVSKPEMLDWVAHARSQARRVKPDVTVVFLGANDGFPMATPPGPIADCCGDAWVKEYSRRVAQMMRAYARGSKGRVLWLTLPAPRGANFRRVYGPVNAGIRRAGRRVEGVEVVRLDRLFTPGFRYRSAIRWRGRTVTVRQGDGVHLNTTGASIAAAKVVARLGANRLL